MKELPSPRRSFLTGLGVAAVAAAGAGAADAQNASAPAAGAFKAPRHADDDWMDTLPGKHRMVIDAVTPHGAGEAILYANNLYEANKPYGLTSKDLAIIVVMRHFATPFAFNDEIWAKYGKVFSAEDKFTDPKTGAIPAANFYRSGIEAHVKRGVHFAVCDLSTNRLKSAIARSTEGKPEAIYKELTGNAIGNAHFVAAGILAVGRAQERGYAMSYVG